MTELGPKTRLPTRLPDVKTPSWAGEEPRRHVSAAELAHARSTGALPKKDPHHQRHRGGTIRKRTHFFVFCSRLFFAYAGGDTGASCRRGGACLARLLQCDATQKRDSVPLLFFFIFYFLVANVKKLGAPASFRKRGHGWFRCCGRHCGLRQKTLPSQLDRFYAVNF